MNKQPQPQQPDQYQPYQYPVPLQTLGHLNKGLEQVTKDLLDYRPDSSITDQEVRLHLAVLTARRDLMLNILKTLRGV